MKEIKFRAVIREKNITLHFTLADLVQPNPLFSIRQLLIPWLLAGNTPDEGTSLSDKNGTPIYESDILLTDEAGWHGKVVFQRAAFILMDSFGGWSVEPNWEDCEVIGNIWENPELLK